jgi:hypothetical protein
MFVSSYEFFSDNLSAIFFKEIAVETDRSVCEKNKLSHACGKMFDLGWVGRCYNQRADGISWCYIEYGKTMFHQELFFANSDLTVHGFTRTYFQGRYLSLPSKCWNSR